jgi:hypothetical protein
MRARLAADQARLRQLLDLHAASVPWLLGEAEQALAHVFRETDEERRAFLKTLPRRMERIRVLDADCARAFAAGDARFSGLRDELAVELAGLAVRPVDYEALLAELKQEFLPHALCGLAQPGTAFDPWPQRRERARFELDDYLAWDRELDLAHASLRTTQQALFDAHREAAVALGSAGSTARDATARALHGLHRATQNFDPARGYRFFTYAQHWISRALQVPSLPPHWYPQDAVGAALAALHERGVDLHRERAVAFFFDSTDEVLRRRLERMGGHCEVQASNGLSGTLATYRFVPSHETLSAYLLAFEVVAAWHSVGEVGWQIPDA